MLKFHKKILALLVATLFAVPTIPAYAAQNGNSNGNNDESYYQAVSKMISSNWDDSYFATATLSIGGDTLKVDNRTVKLNNKAKILDGELVLPSEVFEALGVRVPFDAQGAEPVLPASALSEAGLGFEVALSDADGLVTITNEYQMARVVAKVKPGKAAPQNVAALQAVSGPDGLQVYQFKTAEQAKAACEALNASPDVEYAEPDKLVALDAEPAYELDDYNAAAYTHLGWGPSRIGSDTYLDYLISSGKQNASVTVAVVDTGIDSAHPYFTGRLLPGYNFISNNNSPVDGNGHGTHVSGTVVDVTVALPNVKIMPVKVLNDDGRGTSLQVANGVRWAVDNGARVVNMSLGGDHSQTDDDAVAYAIARNVTVVVAAGNESDDAENHCPAHVAAAITVSAFDSSDRPASFTNFGTCVDVAAPGVNIVSTLPGNRMGSYNGTSMATPHVTGAVALVLCDNQSLTPAAAKAIVCSSVDAISVSGDNKFYGRGILNIGKAAGTATPQFIFAEPGGISENIYSGAKQTQIAVKYYDGGVITDVTNQASYLSGNAAVAVIAGPGLIEVRGAGKTNVTASYNGRSVAIPVSGESVAPLTVLNSIPANGDTNVKLDTTIYLQFNQRLIGPVTYTLLDPAGRNVGWSVQWVGTTVTIELAELLKPDTEYTFTIRAGGARSAYGPLEKDFVMKFNTGAGAIVAPMPESVTVSPSEAVLTVNTTRQLTAAVAPAGANNAITWTSSNTAVATVSATGLVTARDAGTAVITAKTVNNLTAACSVTVPDTTPPVITLTGGSSITVNLGSVFVEPGYRAVDNVDGDVTSRVVVTGTVNTDVAGTYTLTYTVSDNAGNVGRATRTVTVAAPRASFSFSNKGKAGTSFDNKFTAAFGGNAVFTMSGLDNKTTVTLTVKNSVGAELLKNTFTANGSKGVYLAAGSYTATVRIDSTNGNTSVDLGVVIVGDGMPAPRTAPTVALVGSSQIVLHLGGSPYVEQGVRAMDTVDGEIGGSAVIESNVDTSKAGNYTVKYTVTNTAGLSASVTRSVRVIAPETRQAPGKTYSFSPKGKQGESFTYNFDVAVAGSVSLTVSGLNKTNVTVTVSGPSGNELLKESYAANATRSFQAPAGKCTVKAVIDSANGNTSFGLAFATPGGIETYFPLPEVTR